MLLSACDHKDLYTVGHELYQVRVDFDYSDVDQTPKAMRVLFYPSNAAQSPYKFDLSGEGGYVRIPAGNYQVLAYNVDTENVFEVGDDNYYEFTLTTQNYEVEDEEEEEEEPGDDNASYSRSLFGSRVPKGRGEGNFLLYDAPEWTCVCRSADFVVEPDAVVMDVVTRADSDNGTEGAVKERSLTLQAADAVCVVNLVAEGIEGVEQATMVRGTLSGIAAARYVALDSPSSEPGMVSFAGNIDREAQVIRARFFVWDFVPADNGDMRQYMNLYIWSNTGNYYMSADVTDVLQDASDTRLSDVTIKLKLSLNIMPRYEGNSGFSPGVGEWQEEHSDLPLF